MLYSVQNFPVSASFFTSQVLNEYFKQNDNKVVSNNEPTKKIVSERHEKHERSRNTTLSVAFFLPFVWSLLFLRITFLRGSKNT